MRQGRAPDPVWASHFKRNPDPAAAKRVYVDLYDGLTHTGNAQRAKRFLAFHCEKFKNERPQQWQRLVAAFTYENIKSCKPQDKVIWERCRAAEVQRTTTKYSGGAGYGLARVDHMPSAVAAAGAYGGTIACGGFAAAELQLRATGRQFTNKLVDSISQEELDSVNQLLFRMITRQGLPLGTFDSEFFKDVIKALRPAAAGKTLTADMIRRNGMIRKAFDDVRAAVQAIQDKASGFSVQIDGWTDGNGDYLMQLIKVISGYAFYDSQPTSQGERCDAGWTIEQCKEALSDKKCCALTADNCSVMQDTKDAFLKLAETLKHLVFYASCQWHGGDSIGAALIGEGGLHTAEHVLEQTTGPQVDRWTMNATKANSIPTACKSIVKMVKRRHRIKGYFKGMQAKESKAAVAQWRDECAAAKAAQLPLPPRPRKFPMLALPGKTRKLSITNTFATLLKNKDLLDALVRSAHFEKYVKEQKASTKNELNDIAALIKEGVIFERVRPLSLLFDILQTHQRLCEKSNSNLSDGAYNICEMLARVGDFKTGSVITAAHLKTVKEAIIFRFKKLYTPNYALAIMLDPRRKFSDVGCEALIDAGYNIRADARNCLEKRIKVLPDKQQKSILQGYNKLVAGQVFTLPRDADKLEEANNMPLSEWYETYRTEAIEDLSVYVGEPLAKVSLCQAGTERLNSAAKFIQEGRLALSSENSRMLTSIYVNGRLLDEFHRNVGVEKEPGFFRLGHWPPRDAAVADVDEHMLDDTEAEGDLETERHVLRDAIALLDADDEEAALILVQAHGGAATKRKRGSASAAAAGGTPASAGGRAATAGGKAAPGAPPPANKRRAKAKSVPLYASSDDEDDADDESGSDSGDDADALEDDGSDGDDE